MLPPIFLTAVSLGELQPISEKPKCHRESDAAGMQCSNTHLKDLVLRTTNQ